MDNLHLLKKIEQQYENNLPFVLYSYPEKENVNFILQKDAVWYDTESSFEEYFIFSPFDSKNKAICIPLAKSYHFETNYLKTNVEINEIETSDHVNDKKSYLKLVADAIQNIQSQKATKIVISRKKVVQLKEFNLLELIERMLNLYPKAFRYVWYHPSTGLWCGASPEVLLETDGDSFRTMALAGTQKNHHRKKVEWNLKEKNEQQVVVDSIQKSLKKITSNVTISNTYNHKAGSLIHLRTDISGTIKKAHTGLRAIMSLLHPTSAVCGLPKNYAKTYILEKENYKRDFYTGFLGFVDESKNNSRLFVNLRCMKIENTTANLYLGCGITKDSDPSKEWEETSHKSQTMLQVISSMI